MRHPVQKGEGGLAGRWLKNPLCWHVLSRAGAGTRHKAQVIRAPLLFQVIQLSDQDGKIHDGGFSPYSVVGQWKVAARNFTTHQEGCPAPSTAAATVNPSIASGEHPARDTLDPSQSVAEGWGQKTRRDSSFGKAALVRWPNSRADTAADQDLTWTHRLCHSRSTPRSPILVKLTEGRPKKEKIHCL